jgi:vancomycin resistance protein YoaR
MIEKQAPSKAAQLTGIDTRIGYFVTHFNPGEVGRTQTVRRAIDLIDGSVVAPGAIFSINQTVGERTAERGFGIGHVFINGKMEKQLGGGMCQVATTLFNAAMLADLKIVERHQHVRTVPYVSPGRDSTVYWGQKDFKLQNDTDTPIYISYKTTRTHAIVTLFGKGVPGRKVTLVSHYRQLAERHFTGVFYRIVSYPDGHTEKSHPYYSDYEWTPALDFSR